MIPPCSYRGVPADQIRNPVPIPFSPIYAVENTRYYQALGYPGLLAAWEDDEYCPVSSHIAPGDYMRAGAYFEFIRAVVPDDVFRKVFVYVNDTIQGPVRRFNWESSEAWVQHLQCVGLFVSYSITYDTFAVNITPRHQAQTIPDEVRAHYLEHFG